MSGSRSRTTSRVSVFGAQGENCARFLTKGRAVAIDGRLRWRQWDAPGRHEARGGRRSWPRPCSSSARARTAAVAAVPAVAAAATAAARGSRARAGRPGRAAPVAGGSDDVDDDIPF